MINFKLTQESSIAKKRRSKKSRQRDSQTMKAEELTEIQKNRLKL